MGPVWYGCGKNQERWSYWPLAVISVVQNQHLVITDFRVKGNKNTFSSPGCGKVVTWQHNAKKVKFEFEHEVSAYHIEYLDEVLIQAWVNDFYKANLFIYHANGTLKARPAMPKLRHEVYGVYSVWFEQGKKQITMVLHCDEYQPYDTACTFNVETHAFSQFHPTK